MTPAGHGLYVGSLRHRRLAPVRHEFTYSIFMALLDVDRLPEAMAASKFTSYNRFNWASFHDADHIGDPSLPLRERLARSAANSGLTLPSGPIYLLTHLRYAGYVFNPISIYYCYDPAGVLSLVLADVRNTYGGRREYWLRPVDAASHRFRAVAAKSLYVSPFMPYDVGYEFVLTPPESSLVAHMNVAPGAGGGKVFDATLTLDRRPWNAAGIRRALCRFPLMTGTVIAAIHWQALRLWLKGVPVQPFAEELQS